MLDWRFPVTEVPANGNTIARPSPSRSIVKANERQTARAVYLSGREKVTRATCGDAQNIKSMRLTRIWRQLRRTNGQLTSCKAEE